MGLDVNSASGLLYKIYRGIFYRASIEEVKLRRPTVKPPIEGDESDFVFTFLLGFKMSSSSPDLANNARFAVVIEYDSNSHAGGRDSLSFGDAVADFDGLCEPQLTPIEFRTDLETFLQVRDARDPDAPFSEKILLDSRIKLKIKASADGVNGTEEMTTIWRLLENWSNRNTGMELRMFADSEDFEDLEDLEDLPGSVIGDDILITR